MKQDVISGAVTAANCDQVPEGFPSWAEKVAFLAGSCELSAQAVSLLSEDLRRQCHKRISNLSRRPAELLRCWHCLANCA